MSHPFVTMIARARRRWWLAAALSLLANIAIAEPRVDALPPFELRGVDSDGLAVSTDALRGRVVMVYYRSTGCAVCIDKLHELRANAAGWRDKAFRIVVVNVDRTHDDLLTYERAAQQVLRTDARLQSLWRGAPGFRDSLTATPQRLPLTLVLDTDGRVAARHEGRMPPEVWDRVADLLP